MQRYAEIQKQHDEIDRLTAQDALLYQRTAEERDPIDFDTEQNHLHQYLLEAGLLELMPGESKAFLDGGLTVSFMLTRAGADAWFNIRVNVKNADLLAVRDAVYQYAYDLFRLIEASLVTLNRFVLSFQIQFQAIPARRSILLRANRTEIQNLICLQREPIAAIEVLQ